MSAPVAYVCDEAEARVLTEAIRARAEQTWQLIEKAYTQRAWSAMGYASWDAYCSAEFGTTRLRLPREERSEVVASLRDAGMSLRAISAATGESKNTVHRTLVGVPDGTPATPGYDIAASVAADLAAADGDYAQAAADDAVTYECRACHAVWPVGRDEGDGLCRECHDNTPAAAPKITGTDGKQYAATSTAAPRAPRTDVVSVMSRALSRAQDAAHSAALITAAHLTHRNEEAAVWSRDLSASLQTLQRLLDALQEASK